MFRGVKMFCLGGDGRLKSSGGGSGVQWFGDSKVSGYGFWCPNELFCHQESSDPRSLVPCHVLCSCVSVSVSASLPVL